MWWREVLTAVVRVCLTEVVRVAPWKAILGSLAVAAREVLVAVMVAHRGYCDWRRRA